jgi:hypothetical protein
MENGIDPRNKSLILVRLEPVVPLLTQAAENAIERARSYFKDQTLESAKIRDPYLFAHIVRHQVCAFLNDRGQAAAVDTRWLPNSGVAFGLEWLDARFLKSYFGKLPAPGHSPVKQAFYQQTIARGLWDAGEPSFERVNIVITWDVDSSGTLSALEVYSPCGGGTGRDSARYFWSETLAHPAVTYQPAPEDEYADEIDEEEREDIAIERESPAKNDDQGQADDV